VAPAGRRLARAAIAGGRVARRGAERGPKLHHHPYDETFIILEGHVLVQVGDETVEGGPGDIVIGPPGVPHGFRNLGPGRARLVCIHAAPAMQTKFLE
jgi:mannose-6-phosphate isomerase-like protein (cupin superfamily)